MARARGKPLIFMSIACAAGVCAAGQQLDTKPPQAQTKQQAQPQLKTRDQKQAPSADTQTAEPQEEDEETKTDQVYAFNPVRALSELHTGNFYFKKGNYRAAMRRFQEAGKWNPGYAEAFLRTAEAAEKLKDTVAEREAYGKYLDISPDAKNAASIKKKLASLH